MWLICLEASEIWSELKQKWASVIFAVSKLSQSSTFKSVLLELNIVDSRYLDFAYLE